MLLLKLFRQKTIVWLLLGIYSTLVFASQGLHLVPGLNCGASHGHDHTEVVANAKSREEVHSGVCQHRHHSGCHRNQSGQDIANKQLSEFAAADGDCSLCKLLAILCGALHVGSQLERLEASCSNFFLSGTVDVPALRICFRSRAPPAIA